MIVMAVAVAVSLMHGEAQAQTDIKIGVLLSHPNDIDAGPWEAMQLAESDLNMEYTEINSTVTLKMIDVSDFTNVQSVVEEISGAIANGFKHFIVPSDEVAIGIVKGIIQDISPDSIMISPASSTVISPFFNGDDNLFRLIPNNDALAKEIIPVYDEYNTNVLLMVIDVGRGSYPFPAPVDVRDRYGVSSNPAPSYIEAPDAARSGFGIVDDSLTLYATPGLLSPTPDSTGPAPGIPSWVLGDDSGYFQPILTYGEDIPSYKQLNEAAAAVLNARLGDLITLHGADQVGVHFVGDVPHYSTFVETLRGTPGLDYVDDVRWYGTAPLVVAETTEDPLMRVFSADVDLTVMLYEIVATPLVKELQGLENPSRLHNVYANYAAYDAVHLLADSIAIGGADNPNLKNIVFEVSDGRHALEHIERLLGVGALGNYTLDRHTGDLTGVGNFIEHRMVQSNGSYEWLELFDRPTLVCR